MAGSVFIMKFVIKFVWSSGEKRGCAAQGLVQISTLAFAFWCGIGIR